MKKSLIFIILSLFNLMTDIHANHTIDTRPSRQLFVIGGGIIGAFESYYAYQDAQKDNVKICITVYEKGESFANTASSEHDPVSTNTSYNIIPSLTIDEILSVVPRGAELVKKLAVPFNEPGGIRVDDVPKANDSEAATNFKEAVALYGLDENHDTRTQTLLTLGKISMDLWQELYDQGDEELKGILEASNFHPCREPRKAGSHALHDGYRIDLIYGVPNAKMQALNMQADYKKLGYQNCRILSPVEVGAIDPYLADFCKNHSDLDNAKNPYWNNDSVALWRPGGCIDTQVFLPKFYQYLQKIMGHYQNSLGQIENCFKLKFSHEVIAVELHQDSDDLRIKKLKFSHGTQQDVDSSYVDSRYVFCPGEAVGTLHRLGFNEPAYAAFAGASLFLNIPLSPEKLVTYQNFSHCMEVHKEGIVLAWQARVKKNSIFIGVAGTKAFYGDCSPHKDEAFAQNRNLLQLNMINHVLPEFISLAVGYNTQGKELNSVDLMALEKQGILQRWVGRRSVAYDGFPTLGLLYCHNHKVNNARCTTHLGSGGVSFAPGAVLVSRSAEIRKEEERGKEQVIKDVLLYSDSRRTALKDEVN